MNGCVLIGSFIEAKVIGKHFVVLRAVAEGVTFACSAPCVNVQQLCCRIAHLFCRFAFGFFPLPTAQAMQGCFVGTHACVATNQLQLADGHIQRGFVGIFQMQKLLQGWRAIWVLLAQIHVDQTAVTPNAVGVVHHGVAHIELRQIFDERFNVAHLFLFFSSARADACRKEFGLCDQVNAGFKPMKARIQSCSGNAYFFIAGLKLLEVIKGGWVDAPCTQKIEQAFAPARALCQD